MLYSQGVSMDDLGIGQPQIKDPRKVWRIFASHYYLFRGTPTRIWLDYAFQELFGMKERLSEKNADLYLRHHRRETAARRSSCPAPSSSASTSKSSPPPIRPSIRSRITRPFAPQVGTSASFPPSAPTPSSIRISPDLPASSKSSASRPAKTPPTGPAT